jgi:uncharacterized protein YciI
MSISPPNLFACVSQYLKSPDEIAPHIQTHIEWLGALDAAGKLVTSGRQVPPAGGVIVLAGESREAVQALLATDPFALHGCASYWIFEFELNPEPIRGRLMDYFVSEAYAAQNREHD